MFKSFGPWEIALVVLLVLIIFGAGKLPQVGSALGKGIRAFRRGQSGDDGREEDEAELPEPTVAKTARVKKAAK